MVTSATPNEVVIGIRMPAPGSSLLALGACSTTMFLGMGQTVHSTLRICSTDLAPRSSRPAERIRFERDGRHRSERTHPSMVGADERHGISSAPISHLEPIVRNCARSTGLSDESDEKVSVLWTPSRFRAFELNGTD
jgi:hypothetical protein